MKYLLPKPDCTDLSPDYKRVDEYDFAELKYDGILAQVELQDGLILLGEYMYGSNWAIRNGLEGQLFLFDLWTVNEKNWTLLRRRSAMTKFAHRSRNERVRIWSRNGQMKYEGTFPEFQITELYPIEDANRLWRKHVLEGDFEGLMYKRNREPWLGGFGGMGRRKKVVTMDYVVMGFNQSDADKYRGRMVKSIECGLFVNGELTKITDVGGGLDEITRADMYEHPKRYIGKVVECQGKDLFASGALRHPSFVRLRSDKPVKDCRLPTRSKAKKFTSLSH